ncbi:MAG: S9 family peptidase [Bacteroidales bacterium]|nr:S9 family peptidase [Bacteroidales bacterium]
MKSRVILSFLLLFVTSQLFAQGRLTPEKMWKMGRVGDLQISPDKSTILYGVSTYNLEANSGQRDLYIMSLEDKEAVKVTSFGGSEFNGRFRPDGKRIGFLSGESGSVQLWEMNPNGTDKQQITHIEGGITGFKYAPTMDKILVTKNVKLDKTPQEVYPDLPQTNVRIIDDLMYRHWDEWHDYRYSHIFVAGYEDGKMYELADIMKGEPYDSPTQPWGGTEKIAWSPDGKKIAYTCKKLTGKDYSVSTNTEIYLYDTEAKTTENLSNEGFDGYDMDPVFSPDGSRMVWMSMETPGYEADKERMILYDFATGETTNLTKDFNYNASHYVWGPRGDEIYFISGINATYQLFSIDLKKEKINRITKGHHNYQSFVLADDGLIGTKMSMSLPTEIFHVDKKGNEEQLTFTNKPVLDGITMGNVEERWIETTDGKEMLTWVIYPPNFDPDKTYPALLYCQGGPQSAVSQFFSYRWNFQIMAANDYIIVAPNRRGLPTFGQEWNAQISEDYGGQNIKDYFSAIDAVAKEAFVDENRLGAVGASYGGFSVFYLAGHHEGRFSAFISHCGMYNFESWYGSTEEYWFPNHDLGGPFWEDPRPESYKYSPHLAVEKWDTPILIISGGNDFRIPYTESMQAFHAAQLQDIPSKFLFFPDESHFVLQPQNAVLWQREFFGWLDKWLK